VIKASIESYPSDQYKGDAAVFSAALRTWRDAADAAILDKH
jgi:hypothetical protein